MERLRQVAEATASQSTARHEEFETSIAYVTLQQLSNDYAFLKDSLDRRG